MALYVLEPFFVQVHFRGACKNRQEHAPALTPCKRGPAVRRIPGLSG